MSKVTKRKQYFAEAIESEKQYAFQDAVSLLKNAPKTKFNQSVDVAINLGIDATKSTQNVRGSAALPAGSGKALKVAVFCEGEDVAVAKEEGAAEAGLEDLIEKIKGGDLSYDVIISHADVMNKVAALGRILGPRGLMPNPRTGTVTSNVRQTVIDTIKGRMAFRNDKFGVIHGRIGNLSFSAEDLKGNLSSVVQEVKRLKPAESKGIYITDIYLSSTMGPGVKIESSEFV